MAVTAAFLYFALNGKSFIWNEDGYAQHNLALTYYGKWLRDIIRNILFEHTFSILLWDFSLGTGSDILTTLNYYVIGEPLNLLFVFVSARYTEYLYDFLIILRLYFAGLAFMHFCRVMGRKGNGITFVLKYQTPGLKSGLICSGIGIFMLLIITLVFKRKSRMMCRTDSDI